MKGLTKVLLTVFTLLFFNVAFALASPIGYWKTIDDVTGKPKSILHIYQSGNAIYGQIVKIYPRPGYDENEVCSACSGSRHNKKIVGMVIMQGLTQDAKNPGQWSGGTIMDPLNGKTYRCMITVVGNGQLNVRGYIGVSMFGRTQSWFRVSGPNG